MLLTKSFIFLIWESLSQVNKKEKEVSENWEPSRRQCTSQYGKIPVSGMQFYGGRNQIVKAVWKDELNRTLKLDEEPKLVQNNIQVMSLLDHSPWDH